MAETGPSELPADYVIDQGFDAHADERHTIWRVLFVAPCGPTTAEARERPGGEATSSV